MLIAFVYLYQQAGSFLLEDLYKLNLSATEQLWIFLAFPPYAIKILIPFHTWRKCVPKAPAVGTMLLSGIMLKMGLYSIRWQLPIAPLAANIHLHQFRNCRSYIWFHSCFTPKT
jgi:NADH-quinone oxidoreductase subunit M